MDAKLRLRLIEVGIDPDRAFDPTTAWAALYERFGKTVTIIERYQLEAHVRGVLPEELPPDVKRLLSNEVLEAQFPGIELVGESGGDPVHVVPYDPAWPDIFADWKAKLVDALGDAPIVRHVGSTSVPGLAAKPVIDIQISVSDIEDEPGYVTAIESTGVSLRSRDSLHRYFRPAKGQPRVVQVHVCKVQGTWSVDHVLFRDFLRAHVAVRDEYARLKTELAVRHRDDRLAYTDAKAPFIIRTLESARIWASETDWSLPFD